MSESFLNRREFLGALAASGLAMGKLAASGAALGLGIRSDGAGSSPHGRAAVTPHDRARHPADVAHGQASWYTREAARLTDACMSRFWDGGSRMFRAPVLSAETVPSDALHDRGYTLWPSLIALHALVEGEKRSPGAYAQRIADVCDGLEQYFSHDLSAYTSWIRFPGNIDAYYDDNAWVVIVMVEASQALRKTHPTRAASCLDTARTVMANFVVKGYDDTGRPGGMRWGYDPAKPNTSDRGTSSTAGAALAALVLARAGVDARFYTEWGHKLLTWLTTRLLDKDGLVMDALAGADWKPRAIKWTYNTGVPMRAYVEHYRLTKSAESLSMAVRMARAAIDRGGALFDQTVHDPAKRFYWDETYFVHYLVDGLIQVAKETSDAKLASALADAALRSADYAYAYLRDPVDGLYWRNWRLYTIGDEQLDVWQQRTGQTIHAAFDPSERSQEQRFQALAVKDRPLVKTLLANAGAARLFWLASHRFGGAGS
jgi:predicted alpha-1,6-mannanase (GH76 family)